MILYCNILEYNYNNTYYVWNISDILKQQILARFQLFLLFSPYLFPFLGTVHSAVEEVILEHVQSFFPSLHTRKD